MVRQIAASWNQLIWSTLIINLQKDVVADLAPEARSSTTTGQQTKLCFPGHMSTTLAI